MEWMEDYNLERPHEALAYRTPVDLLKELK